MQKYSILCSCPFCHSLHKRGRIIVCCDACRWWSTWNSVVFMVWTADLLFHAFPAHLVTCWAFLALILECVRRAGTNARTSIHRCARPTLTLKNTQTHSFEHFNREILQFKWSSVQTALTSRCCVCVENHPSQHILFNTLESMHIRQRSSVSAVVSYERSTCCKCMC